ncbi:cytochrome c oxidase subunit 3 [Flavobacterium agricola]|uniref:Cytochrome c oxidase subunit 3 n=1 Tax=Flavobacterium agricola TaxID=2870839 RepID=A0ABY6M1K8_9FLAO|nr:cytochrome c oxidase subunit 3 [Flavobacterium agricola]UYW00758.1 cytochrome c oxidase subunit 3 [Flavobacterium agricola]
MGAIANETHWGGGEGVQPLGASYGKLMMWFFILSDSLTFAGFLAAYGFARFKFIGSWPIADEVFNHFPFLHGVDAPMYYVALMTFILIFSSVTMVLAVDAGKKMQQTKVAFYMLLTIIGGLVFVGSQAWEWKNFIQGTYGALETKGGSIIQFVNTDGERVALGDFAATIPHERVEKGRNEGVWFTNTAKVPTYSLEEVVKGFEANPNILIRTEQVVDQKKVILNREESLQRIKDANMVVEGASLIRNEYGHKNFGNFFFFITGFHGFHVSVGIILNIIVFFNVLLGTYERRRNYEMVEKVGLYWHFVDLVWVFVFTFFYLV